MMHFPRADCAGAIRAYASRAQKVSGCDLDFARSVMHDTRTTSPCAGLVLSQCDMCGADADARFGACAEPGVESIVDRSR